MGKYRLVITGDLGFEVWQDIPGYEGEYKASTYGNIFSIKRHKLLAKSKNADGYLFFFPCKMGESKYLSLQRAIALTFLPKPQEGQTEVNHKDENKLNNRVENLEWCTHKYNMLYGTAIQRTQSKTINGKCSKSVVKIDSEGVETKYPSLSEVHRILGYPLATIHRRCIDNKPYNGYIWKFA